MKELLVSNLKESLDNEEFKQLNDLLNGNKYDSINPMYFIKSIRNVKRIANQMIFSLRKLHGEIDICDYFTLELFRQQYKPIVDLLVKRKSEISETLQDLTLTVDSAAKTSLINSPFPLIIVENDGNIIWKSSRFVSEFANIDINTYVTDINLDPKETGLTGSPTRVKQSFSKVVNKQIELKEGTSEELVEEIVARIKARNLL